LLVVVGSVALGFVYGLARGSTAYGQTPAQAPAPVAVPATPESAKPFLGDWTATLDAPQGPAAFSIGIKIEAGTVVATVSNEMLGQSSVSNITR
jgi:hypothetical protein